MVRVIEIRSYDANQFWKEYTIGYQKRDCSDNIGIIKVMDSYCLLMSDNNLAKIHYFDLDQNKIFDIYEDEVLSFIDQRAVLQNREAGVQEHVEVILNILCKKIKSTCISDLRMKQFNRGLLQFVDKEIYKEEYQYIIQYLESK